MRPPHKLVIAGFPLALACDSAPTAATENATAGSPLSQAPERAEPETPAPSEKPVADAEVAAEPPAEAPLAQPTVPTLAKGKCTQLVPGRGAPMGEALVTMFGEGAEIRVSEARRGVQGGSRSFKDFELSELCERRVMRLLGAADLAQLDGEFLFAHRREGMVHGQRNLRVRAGLPGKIVEVQINLSEYRRRVEAGEPCVDEVEKIWAAWWLLKYESKSAAPTRVPGIGSDDPLG